MSDLVNEAVGFNDFEKWLSERSKWLQTAARHLIDQKRLPNDVELAELVRLCKLEAANKDDPGFLKVPAGAFSAATASRVVRLEEVTQVLGVNAIKPGASLAFGKGSLTVIYGQNGSGKSGYARLLKQLCGSRSKDDIRPNVFSQEPHACSAQCQFTVDGAVRDFNWQPGAELPPMLKQAQVFDSKAATQYMGKTESSYEPSSMRFISLLIQVSDKVSAQLTAEKGLLVSALPHFPADLADTGERAWLASLKPTVTAEKIEAYCQFDAALNEERIKGEALLAETNIEGRLAAIGKDTLATANIKKAIQSLKDGLNDVMATQLYKLKNDAMVARQAANAIAQKAFAGAPLQGVGEPAWNLMWEKAREFSTVHAYPGQAFPATGEGAHCVLCQQELTPDGSLRLKSFEAFVSDGLEAAAKKAEIASKTLIDSVIKLPALQDWTAHLAQLQFDEAVASAWYESLKLRRSQFIECLDVNALLPFDWGTIDQAVEKRTAALAADQVGLAALQQDGQRQVLEKRVKQLKALQWLSENKAAILFERERLIAADQLSKAGKLAATNALTTKHKELAVSELDAGYQARFAAELLALGGKRLPVAPQSKAHGKGLITFGLTLVGAYGNHPPEAVLSEGETRIVALAAFLADTTGSNQRAPFIFDDPISSLDQDFEERVVARLVELAKARQVIVFTHRLSLIALIESGVKQAESVGEPIDHTVQSLRRLNKVAGLLAQHNLRDAKPDKGINLIRNQIIPQLKKLQGDANVEAYDFAAKSACSDFRIVLERTVEYTLLNEVVKRFRRDVTTKGRLRDISKVTPADCDYIDQLMTKYSAYEHSQAEEMPQIPVELVEFEQDVLELIAWMDEFKARAV